MTYEPVAPGVPTAAPAALAPPQIRRISVADLREALRLGINDFAAMPSYAIMLCLIYPIAGLIMARLAFGYAVLPLIYPLAAGFALIGPVASVGFEELSRRREQGLDVFWTHAFDVFRSRRLGDIAVMALALLVIFIAWLVAAQTIYFAIFGSTVPTSASGFAHDVLATRAGWKLIVVGNGVGFLFALAVLIVSVVAFPLLLDREVSAPVAAETSIRAVLANPVPMALWGLIVAASLLIGSLPLFFGLAIVVPILGHATWHLYRKVVEPDPNPRPPIEPQPRARRSAADFPASLFG
jgi:uncharacterized membrane protein